MLDLVYVALVATPLTLAMIALLLIAVRSFRGDADERRARRRTELGRAAPLRSALVPDAPAPARAAAAVPADGPPADDPPAREPPGIEELTALVESLPYPPRALPRERAEPRPHVGAPAAETKVCPDCAEQILAAARVCKHCRYRFGDSGDSGDARISA